MNWTIPTANVALTAYRNRNEIKNIYDTFINNFNKKTTIAVTGMSGVGKTVLTEYITNEAYKIEWITPTISQDSEIKQAKLFDKCIKFIVIPGQRQGNRTKIETKIIDSEPVDGIIHVVANGYALVRDTENKNFLVSEGIDTINKLRVENIKIEISDLRKTIAFVKRIHDKHQKPNWLILLANKVDLYSNKKALKIAEDRYEKNRNSSSQIVQLLNDLQAHIGNKFKWESFYVSSRIEKYEWNNIKVNSTLDENQRDYMLREFIRNMTTFCK